MTDRPTAIIIEDDSRLALLFNANCNMAGFRSEVILKGSEAISFLQDKHLPQADLVLLDIYLPGANGEIILEHLKEQFADTLVIVITADPLLAQKHSVNAEWSLTKPVSWDDLNTVLLQAFERKRAAGRRVV